MDSSKPSICFVAHNAFGALTGGKDGHIGGVERQTSLMANWFAARGYRVSMITWDEGQEDGEIIDGVRVLKLCRQDAGIPGLRFFWPRWTSLIAAMKRADADVYYQNLMEYVTGQVARWCHCHGRAFVYSAASDRDCDPPWRQTSPLRTRLLYRYGLRNADAIIVQTQRQCRMIQEHLACKPTVLPMPCPGPSAGEYRSDMTGVLSRNILWIGRICKVKRPDRLLNIAALCPDCHFDMVGPQDDTEYAREVCRQVQNAHNVTWHGPAPRERVAEFYRKATLMCCTSDSEGFPNTFLEAWSYGVPIVTTFDPDDVIAHMGLGIAAASEQALAAGITELCDKSEWRNNISIKARRLYIEKHAVDVAMRRFERVFAQACGALKEEPHRTSLDNGKRQSACDSAMVG